jgi:Skp family chaperone for outer membrane proteins
MRAAEIGLRALAVYLGITLPLPLELAGWQELINKIESEIKAKRQNLAKGSVKDEELKFCSNAVALFAHLNDAYRIHVAHARQIYEEDQARSILDRTKEFLESLATKIKESP